MRQRHSWKRCDVLVRLLRAPRVDAVEEDAAQAVQAMMPEAGVEEAVAQKKAAVRVERAVPHQNPRRPLRGLLVSMLPSRRRVQV